MSIWQITVSPRQTYIVLGQQVEGAKLLIVIQVKRPRSLELLAEVLLHCGLDSGLFCELLLPHLLLFVAVMIACGPCGAS